MSVILTTTSRTSLADEMSVNIIPDHSTRERIQAIRPLKPGLEVLFGVNAQTRNDDPEDISFSKSSSRPALPSSAERHPLIQFLRKHQELYRDRLEIEDTSLALGVHCSRLPVVNAVSALRTDMNSGEEEEDEQEGEMGATSKSHSDAHAFGQQDRSPAKTLATLAAQHSSRIPRDITFTREETATWLEDADLHAARFERQPLLRLPDRSQCQLAGANAFLLALLSENGRYTASWTFMTGIKLTERTSCRVLDSSLREAKATIVGLASREYTVLDSLETINKTRFLHRLGFVTIWSKIKDSNTALEFELSHFFDRPGVIVLFLDSRYLRIPSHVFQAQAILDQGWTYVTPTDRSRTIRSVNVEWPQARVQAAINALPPLTGGIALRDDELPPACRKAIDKVQGMTDPSEADLELAPGQHYTGQADLRPLSKAYLKALGGHVTRVGGGSDPRHIAVRFTWRVWRVASGECGA